MRRQGARLMKNAVAGKVQHIHCERPLETVSAGVESNLLADDGSAVQIAVAVERPGGMVKLEAQFLGLRPDPNANVAGGRRRRVIQQFGPIAMPYIETLIHHLAARYERDLPQPDDGGVLRVAVRRRRGRW